jgi:hypothetical protein
MTEKAPRIRITEVKSGLTLSFATGNAWVKPSIEFTATVDEGQRPMDVAARLQQRAREFLIQEAQHWTAKEEHE